MTEPANAHAATVVLTITRVFDAPRERVWKEWTEPERFADWFGGAECEVPLSRHLHGRQTWRLLASDDVRGPRTRRDPLEG